MDRRPAENTRGRDPTFAAIRAFVAGVTPEVPLDEIDAVAPLLSFLCAELNEQRVGPEDAIRPEQLHGRAEDLQVLRGRVDQCGERPNSVCAPFLYGLL